MVIITGRNLRIPGKVRGGTGGFVKNKGTELGVWLDCDVIVSCEACIVFGEYGGEKVCFGEDGDVNIKDGGRVGEDGSLPVNGVVFLFLRMLLGESSGLRDGVLALDGRGVEDSQTSLLSFSL